MENQEDFLNQLILFVANVAEIKRPAPTTLSFTDPVPRPLSASEAEKHLRDLLKKPRGVILLIEKYGSYFTREQLELYNSFFGSDYEVGWHIKEFMIKIPSLAPKTLKGSLPPHILNRRFNYLRNHLEDSAYFSQAEIIKRQPDLYYEMVGKYITVQEEIPVEAFERSAPIWERLLLNCDLQEQTDWLNKMKRQHNMPELKAKMCDQDDDQELEEYEGDDDIDENEPWSQRQSSNKFQEPNTHQLGKLSPFGAFQNNQPQNTNNFAQSQNTNNFNQSQNTNNFNQLQNTNNFNQSQNTNNFNQSQNTNNFNQLQNNHDSNKLHHDLNLNLVPNANECQSRTFKMNLNPNPNEKKKVKRQTTPQATPSPTQNSRISDTEITSPQKPTLQSEHSHPRATCDSSDENSESIHERLDSLIEVMVEQWLYGLDTPFFDYSRVDEDPQWDDNLEMERDAQDSWFEE